MEKIESLYRDFLTQQDNQDQKRQLVGMEHPHSTTVRLGDKNYVNFSSNDYLGLSHHTMLKRRAAEWANLYGAGVGASRLVTGNIKLYKTIENKISAFKNYEAAIIMVSGYQANSSILPALFNKKILKTEPLVFCDKLNHASMHMGCAAANIKQIRYHHNDMEHLENLLEKHITDSAPKFILTESVFSMDGDIAPLNKIYALAKKYNCFTIVDEAHATGVLGENGKGIADKADVVIGTFGKAMGSFGAYVACSKTIKEYLVNKCGGLIYATALPPTVLGSIDAALDLVPSMNREREKLQGMGAYVRSSLQKMGYNIGSSMTQIIPVIIGKPDEALSLSKHLKESGIWVNAIRPPTVPKDESRLRVTLSSAHTHDQVEHLIHCFRQYTFKKSAS